MKSGWPIPQGAIDKKELTYDKYLANTRAAIDQNPRAATAVLVALTP
jgi:hypothetical protein